MYADVTTLYRSDFYRVINFKCRCEDCQTSKPEFVDSFSISFIRKGNFIFNVFRNSFDSHTGKILLTKPGYEHTVKHIHHVPDECTILEFTSKFYREICRHYHSHRFLADNDIHSIQISTSSETEFLHHYLLSTILAGKGTRLQLDSIVLDVVENTLNFITSNLGEQIPDRMKKNHLFTIEQAKNFMLNNFSEDISLLDIATECCVSPFHFSRIFKLFTGTSPHAFLLSLRIKHAELLLKTSNLKITQIAFISGFNSLEHFSTTFTERFGRSPLYYRMGLENLNMQSTPYLL
ncbi:MAG TPA: AraC family transcriptional regulator [Sphingobacteriaceae bacterium]